MMKTAMELGRGKNFIKISSNAGKDKRGTLLVKSTNKQLYHSVAIEYSISSWMHYSLTKAPLLRLPTLTLLTSPGNAFFTTILCSDNSRELMHLSLASQSGAKLTRAVAIYTGTVAGYANLPSVKGCFVS